MKSLLLTILMILVVYSSHAQNFFRFSGVVIDQEKIEPIEGTYIFNLSHKKESVSDSLGFFTIEAIAGDTLVFRDLRYNSSSFIIPFVLKERDYGIIQLLTPNMRLLDEVKIFSFPTQQEFVDRFMAVDPGPDIEKKRKEVSEDLMKTVKASYKNDRYYYEMWADRRIYELTGRMQPNHLIDPFRWSEFIRNLKGKE